MRTSDSIVGKKIQVKKELDPDFGDVFYVHIDGVKQEKFAKDETTALKATVAHLHYENDRLERLLTDLRKMRDMLRNLIYMVK